MEHEVIEKKSGSTKKSKREEIGCFAKKDRRWNRRLFLGRNRTQRSPQAGA
jgi:hypothetical protein